jgi:hypothetical protein
MEVDALGSTFRIVSGSEFLTLAPTSLEEVAGAAGLSRLTMQHPIWRFASGAWFRRSSREYPIMRRALGDTGRSRASAGTHSAAHINAIRARGTETPVRLEQRHPT